MTDEDTSAPGPAELLPPRDRHALTAIVRLVAACVEGFDSALLEAIRDILLEVTELDGMAVVVEDEDNGTFQLLWRTTLIETGSPIAIGRRHEHAPAHGGFATPPSATLPRIVLDARVREAELSRMAAKLGILSYVMLPILLGESPVGWLIVTHRVPGAPSQRSLPLLLQLAEVLAPAIVRARSKERGALLERVLDASVDGMLAVDPFGYVLEASARALTMLDRTRHEVVGRSLQSVVGDETFSDLFKLLLAGESSERQRLELQLASAKVDVTATRLPERALARGDDARGTLLLCFRDAAPRIAADETASRRLEEAAFLRSLGEAMAGAARANDALARAVDICFVRFELGALCALRGDGHSLALVASHGAAPELARFLCEANDAAVSRLFGADARLSTLKRAVVAEAVSLPGDEPGVLRWMMFVPLLHARRRLGGLVVVGDPGSAAPPGLVDTWEPIANTIAVALRAANEFERVVSLEAEKRQLVDNLPVIVARVDPRTGEALFVNAALQRMLGVRVDELGSGNLRGLLADGLERDASAAAQARAADGFATGWEDRRYRHKDGRILTLREAVYPVHDGVQGVHAVEIIAYDITTEIDARKQLMQNDRLASLGVLAAGVAHEINNPVAFINLAAGQMKRMVDQASRDAASTAGGDDAHERLREMVNEVSRAATQIAEIVGELKLFTRIPEGASSCPVDVNRMLQTAMTLTAADVRRQARLVVDLGALPLAPGSCAGLGHVFANLLINAAQAIEAKHEDAAAEPLAGGDVIRVRTCLEDGAIVVRISDTGIGIDENMLSRIFDPFFKTRTTSSGTGLGLAIAHDVVHRVGGDIRVTSAKGAGTTFEVFLPLEPSLSPSDVPASFAPRPEVAPSPASPQQQLSRLRRVLIIDDEQALVKALARQLSERYEVDTASTAKDALARLSANDYDAVVCDLRLPEQSGPAIYEHVVSRSPEQASRFIFTTGGSYGLFDDEPHSRAEATGLPVLEKPFDGASFEAVVERVAARPAAAAP